ncbi:MAG: MBL fold metallo-hydrolase [Planctomycetota bacterium]|nr:MBL fold metallo-hydrolase [Planctomycetota bacterium]
MQDQLVVPDEALAPDHIDGPLHIVAPDVAYVRCGIVNVVLCGFRLAGPNAWMLIDAGVPGFVPAIHRAASKRFSPGEVHPERAPRPFAILLTHGHFDHVGMLTTLAAQWNVPILAHEDERPFLTGDQSYEPPDPLVGGLMALTSPLLPRGPINVRERLQILASGSRSDRGPVPGMPDWEWIHTPGHTPGHISLWREGDRTLLAGDAVVTTRQEALIDVIWPRAEVHGPPMYFTPDWESAKRSVQLLASLRPELLVTGHGRPLRGPIMREALLRLADDFDEIAVPKRKLAQQRSSRAAQTPRAASNQPSAAQATPAPEAARA